MSTPEETQIEHTPEKHAGGNPAWVPGISGNPAGRPKGARSKFAQDFVIQFAEHWKKNGEAALDELKNKPAEYTRVACTILPKVIELDDDTKDTLLAMSASLPFDAIRKKLDGT